MFKSQFKLTSKEEAGLRNVCVFTALFDSSVNISTKRKMVNSMQKDAHVEKQTKITLN